VTAKRATGRTWATRAGIAVVAGLIAGVSGGVIGLKLLVGDAPPPVSEPIEEEPVAPAPRRQISGPRADGMRAGGTGAGLVGGGRLAARDSVAVVPDLVGRVEGDARRLLERAGFAVGEIMFQEDDLPVGTVLQTFPVPGERVSLPATVNLILADRRRTVDTTSFDPVLGDSLAADSLRADSLGADTVRVDTRSADSLSLDSLFVLPDTLP
jgi:hypothetical protein